MSQNNTELSESIIPYAKGIFGICLNDEVDFRKEKIISWSQYSKYKKCPKSWELRYVHKHKYFSDSIHTIYGTAMHEVIQTFLYYCYNKSVKQANALDLNQMLKDALKKEYLKSYNKHKVQFSSPEELTQYYTYGIQILAFLKKKRTRYFSTKGTELIGIEIPLRVSPDPTRENVKLQQYLDLVFYDKVLKKYYIIDIKTSKRGWNKWKRKDDLAKNQVVSYKKYFCDKFNIDEKKVEVEYFILRNEIDEDSMYPPKPVSQFRPAAGKVKMKQVERELLEFIENCFDENGKYRKDTYHPALTGRNKFNCTFCEFNDRHDLCPPEKRINEYD